MEEDLLNENQERRLQIYFGQLLAEARDLGESLSRAPEPRSSWISLVEADIEHLSRVVHDVADTLGLDVEQKKTDPRRRVAAWASVWWARALDCRPAALLGYGPVDPRLDDYLAPAVEEIAATLEGIRVRVESTAEGPTA